MSDTELNSLLDELAEAAAVMRAELDAMRPQLLAMQAIYTTYIEKIRGVLFCVTPPLPNGSYAALPISVERECEAAVVRVLRKKLAQVNKALGTPK